VYADRPDVLVLALPRGGVPVGYEVAHALKVPLDVSVVRKVGLPGHEEFAMGAVAGGGVTVLDQEVVSRFGLPPEVIEESIARERQELQRREAAYREGRTEPDVAGKTVILVDDGLATGSTMKAAVVVLRQRSVGRVIVAAPVGSRETCETMRDVADAVVCLRTPEQFFAVGEWYAEFGQTTDREVSDLLARAAREAPIRPRRASGDAAARRSP
ncbi:MAG: phosphoribosyltransferase, partial [Gemmatimonadaceae bacterium]